MVTREVRDPHYRARLETHYSYVPWEIWLEILSRLPIKSLLLCQCVCKLWNSVASHVAKTGESLPLCGLLVTNYLKDPRTITYAEYICLTAKETQPYPLDYELSINSGNKSGLLAGLWFNFVPIVERKPISLLSHKGLLLIDFNDGAHEVHNPVSKQLFVVPKSPVLEKHGLRKTLKGSCGLLVNLSGYPGSRCRFGIVRFFRSYKRIELYNSETKTWISSKIELESNVGINAGRNLQSYVVSSSLCETRNQSQSFTLYIVTSNDYGIAFRFNNLNNLKTVTNYSFPLPKGQHKSDRIVERLWDCNNSLFLCYSRPTKALKIWKSGSIHTAEPWSWTPLLYISSSNYSPELSKPVRENLVKIVLSGDAVIPVACHPNMPIMYLFVKPSMFSYNLADDTLVKIADIDGIDAFEHLAFAVRFTPCLNSFGIADNTHVFDYDQRLVERGLRV